MENRTAAMTPLNLQLFAEPGEGEGTSQEGTAQESQQAQQTNEGAGRTYSYEEVQTLLSEANRRAQSEADRRVTQAVNRRDREHQRQMSLSGLDEHERAIRERDQQIEDLQASLREANVRSNHLELVRTLAARDMPVEFADVIDVGEDIEKAQARIEKLDAAFRRAVEDAVNKRIAGRAAPARGVAKNALTREDIMKIADPTERQTAIANNIDLFVRS